MIDQSNNTVLTCINNYTLISTQLLFWHHIKATLCTSFHYKSVSIASLLFMWVHSHKCCRHEKVLLPMWHHYRTWEQKSLYYNCPFHIEFGCDVSCFFFCWSHATCQQVLGLECTTYGSKAVTPWPSNLHYIKTLHATPIKLRVKELYVGWRLESLSFLQNHAWWGYFE